MIIDTFLFNDEFDMLDIHLAITNHFVDRWIVLEASRTFSGIPKPYNLTENFARYQAQYPDRIQVVTLELTAEQTNLICETMMRQGLQPAVDQYSADDIAFAEMMIPHHEGAITMAQKVTGSKNKEVAALAAAIIEAQEKEIAFMRELVKFY